jgi:PAS domain S-box-containing protein
MLQAQPDIDTSLESLTLSWQFNLKNGQFECDATLINLLNSGKKNLTLPQLFASFDRHRVEELKESFKDVIDERKPYFTSVLINIANKRYLVNLAVDYSTSKENCIIGEITFLHAFPSINEEEELVKILFNRASNAILIADKNHLIIKVNEQFLSNSGYLHRDLIGKPINVLKSGQYSEEFYAKLWHIVDTEKFWTGELLAKDKQGEIFAQEIKLQRIELSETNHFYISESKKLDFSTQFIADNPLDLRPGSNCLLSKDDFLEKMNEQFKLLTKNQTIVTVAFSVQLLQKVGDSTLKWLISQRFAESKLTGNIGLINNDIYGAFWVVEKNADRINSALQEVLSDLSGGKQANELDILSIINMAVSVLSVDAKGPQQLISHSVQTLITSPNKKISTINYFDPRLSKRFNRRKILSTLLHEALQNDQLQVYYQPIVDIKNMRIIKFEALMRITLETEINYDTQEIIEIAEQYAWVDKIDMSVATIALRDLKIIRKHYQSEDIGISINRSLSNDKISNCCLEETITLLNKSDIDLNTVTIELTESALFENLDKQKIWVEKLRKLGVSVALDDFGTGYSSFSYLNKLPVNIVKIDKSFITDLKIDSTEYMMIEMLCRLTHKMGGKVVAEGVETASELLLLSQAKVDMLQGYIYSKPVSLKTIIEGSKGLEKPKLLAMCYQPQQPLASEAMDKKFITISADERALEAKEAFIANDVDYLVVIDHKRCLGILTTADLDKALSPYLDTKSEQQRDLLTLEKRIHQIMHKKYYSFKENSPLSNIEAVLLENMNAVVIINNNLGQCNGVITAQRLLAYNFKCNNEL